MIPKSLDVNMKTFLRYGWMVWLGLVGTGCQKKDPPQPTASVPEPPAQNAFTSYVDRGITTIHKADSAATAANGQTQQMNQQTQSVGE